MARVVRLPFQGEVLGGAKGDLLLQYPMKCTRQGIEGEKIRLLAFSLIVYSTSLDDGLSVSR